MHSPSTNPPFDEFEVNLEASQSHLKHQFQCFLAKSRANSFRCENYSTHGSPTITPDHSVYGSKSPITGKFMIKNDEIQKKIDIEDENITLGDIASHGKFWLPKKKEKKQQNKIVVKPILSNNKLKGNGGKWSDQENDLFYKGLEQYGTDFSIISTLFKNRSRLQIKNKFLKEEKFNSDKIHHVFHKKIKKNTHANLASKVLKFHEILHKNDHHNHVFEEFSRDFHDLKTDYHDLNDQTINDHLTNILKNEISDFKKEKDLKKLFNKCL